MRLMRNRWCFRRGIRWGRWRKGSCQFSVVSFQLMMPGVWYDSSMAFAMEVFLWLC